jgi:hypothetical protein
MMGRGYGYGYGSMMGAGPRWGGLANSLITVAAEQLGMSTTELTTELKSGKTIADLAKEHEVRLDEIVDAFLAPRAEQLAEMVANEVLTQEQVDSLLAAMKANVTAHLSRQWSPGGPGWGSCPGGFVDENGDGVCDYAGRSPRFGHHGGPMGRWTR